MNNDEIELIAHNLGHPKGEKGIEVANMMHQTNIKMTLHAIELLNITDNDLILEIGHGNCGHLSQLFEKCNNIQYSGVEISALMHQEAQAINQGFVKSNKARFYCYDGNILPFRDNAFTKIFTVNTLYFWQSATTFLNEIYRVLKPGGLCCITFADRDFMQKLPFTQFGFELYNLSEFEQLAAKSSFKMLKEEQQQDIVTSKTGDMVNRIFHTVCLQK